MNNLIKAMSAAARILRLRNEIEKAINAPRRGPRIPGDGDGDGIPNEGKNKGGPTKRSAQDQHAINAFKEYEGKAIQDAVRWANKEKDQYGTKWMRENLSGYLSERYNIPKDYAMRVVERNFPDDGSGAKVK